VTAAIKWLYSSKPNMVHIMQTAGNWKLSVYFLTIIVIFKQNKSACCKMVIWQVKLSQGQLVTDVPVATSVD